MALGKIGTNQIDTAATPTVASATVTGDLTVDTDTLYVDSTNNRVGVGVTAPEANLDIIGNSDVTAALKIGSNASFGHHFYDSSTNGDLVIKREVSGVQTETLRLNRANGYVTMPYQPSFMVGLSGSYTHTSGNTIQYNDTSNGGHNTGSHFNTSNYTFTAPVAGNYYFFARIAIATGDKTRRCDVKLNKNGSNLDARYSVRTNQDGSGTGGSSYLGQGGSWIVPLAVNDTVKFTTDWETDGTFSSTETLFSHGNYCIGYLLG